MPVPAPPQLRFAPAALAAIALSLSCVQGARAPNVPPRGTLAPGALDPGKKPAEGPFAVVFGAPRGQTTSPAEINLVFNRPMRPLDLAGGEVSAPASLKPQVPGQWRWVGSSGLTFAPEGRLPRATEFTVEVPAGTRALDGSALAAPYVLTFRTERPRVARVEPWSGKDDLRPDARFELRFNQPVDAAEIARSVSITAGDGGATKVPFDVRRPDPKNELLAELVPRAPLPRDSEVEVSVAASLRGREGPLPAGEAQRFSYRTYGPLRAETIECDRDTPGGRCAAEGGISLVFSNSVRFADVKRAISVEPAVKLRWPSWMEDDSLTRHVFLGGRFAPGQSYRVRVAAGLRDEHGQALAAPFSEAVAFADRWPEAQIGLTGSVFEPGQRREIPVVSVNVRELSLAVGAMTEEAVLALEADPHSPGRSPRMSEIAALPSGKRSVLRPAAARNAPATHLVRTADVLGGEGKRGPLAIGISYTERPGTRRARTASEAVIAQVTDLGISAKVSPHGSLVWVTRLSTGAPVPGARVWIRTPGAPAPAAVTTDADGFAIVPASAYRPATSSAPERGVIFARAGDDWTYRRVSDALSGWRFGAPFDFSAPRPFGMLFSDRGIYRPGDTVRVKGIFREEAARGTRTPAGKAVAFKVEGPDGEAIVRQTPRLGAFGTFSADVKIPETARLGTYTLGATVQGGEAGWPDVTSSVEVAEYRPAEFKVGVESDKPSYVRGDKARWIARGDYLFGAPMTNAEVRLSVTRRPAAFTPPGIEGFTVSEDELTDALPESAPREGEVQSGQERLDAAGQAEITATLALPGQRGAELVTCEAEITDVSRQSLAGSSTALVHPAELYVALREPELFVEAGDVLRPEVLAVDPKGARVGKVAVRVELVQRTWTLAREASGSAYRSVTTPVDKVVGRCGVTTAEAPRSCELKVPGAGYYLLHATARDRRGNPVGAAAGVYALGEGAGFGFGDSDELKVELVPDRESYEVGQTARVLVKSPFASADALVTVERAGISEHRRVKLTGAMPTIDVPITEDLRPNSFLSVLILRGRTRPAPAPGKDGSPPPDVGAPAFRLGYAPLRVNPEARRLTVRVTPDRVDARPGDPIRVDVDVRDRGGRPARAEVTLYAVDEGVLSLIGYQTPDPIPVFGAPRSLRVATIETREALARVRNPFADLGADKGRAGGGGAHGSTGVRRDFRQSAYYHPALVTDAAGKARASFKLPDSLTTYRVMAVVVAEDDRFGYGQARVTASRPLMARPALPRFLRAGDAIDAGVVVTSKGLAKATVEVELSATGLTLSGSPRRSIELAPGASTEVRFALSAPQAGPATLRFRASGGGAEDVVEVTRKVQAPASPEAVALYGDTGAASAERLGDLSAIRDDVGGLTVSLSPTALVGLGGGVEQLLEYPYGCTEQLTSRMVPLLALRDLARAYGIALPKDLTAVVGKTVREILSHQRGEGGFGFFAESDRPDLWTTAYALWGLSEAKRHGVAVPADATDRAIAFLRRKLNEIGDDPILRATAPFIVDVLAQTGAPDPGRATRLFEERDELPLFSKALLAHAMVVGKGDRAAVDELVREIEGAVRVDGPVARAVHDHGDAYAVLMDSEARTSALVLRALLAARPAHALAPRLAAGLLADRRGGTWRSTQETAWALLALDQYRRAQEKAAPDFDARVFLGQAELFSASFHGPTTEQARTTIPAARLVSAAGSPLAFSVDGRGRLFYEARLRYARKELPAAPLDRGFTVLKSLRALAPDELAAAVGGAPPGPPAGGASPSSLAFAGGDLVLGEIVVVTPSPRDFVVIDDPLPAGLEAIDARLATSARSLDLDAAEAAAEAAAADVDPDDLRATGRAYNPSRFVREIRDDRVLFFVDHMAAGMYRYRYLARATTLGAFVVPPARAEEMYSPEVFGRTGALAVKVGPRGADAAARPR
ncbi:Ig-like domain-containing protein [Sorangium sp. So ce1036]|uniref:alpha-2-macroglobulin family protein n=1 Tax=Sorangium sp. So ce1036 TaxID=3133328 RepID=UPI003F06F52F